MELSQRSRIGWIIWVGLLSILAGLLMIFLYRRLAKKIPQEQPEQPENNDPDSSVVTNFLTKVKDITGLPDKQCRIITAHAMHESGIFTSDIFLDNNNAFGMRLPKLRKTLATGEKNGYAIFNNISDSINDLLLWFNFHNINPEIFDTVADYCTFLKEKSYYSESYLNYSSAVFKHFKTL